MVWSSQAGPMVWSSQAGTMVWSSQAGPMVWSSQAGPMVWSSQAGPMVWSSQAGPMVWSSQAGPMVWSSQAGSVQSIHILIPYYHFKTLWVLQRILLTNRLDTTLIVGVIRFRKSFTVAMTRKQLAGNE